MVAPAEPLYSLRVADVFSALETSPQGLPLGEVEARQSLYGLNEIVEQQVAPLWRKIAAHLTHPMALLLWGAGILSWVAGDFILGVVVWIVVLVNAGFSYWREYRAEQAVALLRKLLPAYARLIREGQETHVPTSHMVPGDVLVLAEGDHIPADARIIEEYGLRVNNATLTGEAMPARKSADASFREGISLIERPNLIFAGTSVVSGTGKAVVFATGMLTQFGSLARLTQAVKEPPSPLQQELVQITRKISLVALVLGLVVFLIGLQDVDLTISEAFILAMGVVVAALPEGLPATVSLSLAMAVQRLAQRGILVKKLSVVETLGTVSLICTDKSGTLTQNQLIVRQIWVGGQTLSVTGRGYEPVGEFTPDRSGEMPGQDLQALLTAALLCNNARLNPPSIEHPNWTSLGDQTEAALKVAAYKSGLDEARLNHSYPRQHELPFDARRKRMSTIHGVTYPSLDLWGNGDLGGGSRRQIAFVKGAPREVLQLCSHVYLNGKPRPLAPQMRSQILAVNDEYSRGALRVLALGYHLLPPRSGTYTPGGVERDLVFLGLMAMMDPPRPEVAQAVKVCQQAGIRMVMITGDYGLTAESLARRIGMLSSPNITIITGAELDLMDDDSLAELLEQEVIYARMAPEHKLRLVAAYQARGEVVAVTGDGVNDVPALRKADVGVVMGITGTDVARDAADVILTNDNFATITDAIEEGRAVYYNLRKFITYIFSSNVPEILPFLVTSMSNALVPVALYVKQILAIDLGTDIFPALALGAEKPEPDVMTQPPRKRNTPLVDQALVARAFLWLGLIEAILCYLGFFYVYYGWDQVIGQLLPGFAPVLTINLPQEQRYDLARTIFYAGVVMAQVGNAFASRTERNRGRRLGWTSNRLLLSGIGISLTILLVLVYLPFLAHLFDHVSIPGILWIGLAFYPLGIYSLDWLRKAFVRWHQHKEKVL